MRLNFPSEHKFVKRDSVVLFLLFILKGDF